MYIALSLVTSIFLVAVVAGVVPDVVDRSFGTTTNGDNGGPSASLSWVHPHPSGLPAAVPSYIIPDPRPSASNSIVAEPSVTPSTHSTSPTAGLMGRGLHLSDIAYPGSADPSPSVTSRSYPPPSTTGLMDRGLHLSDIAYPGLADPSPSVTSHSYPPPTAGLMDRGLHLSDIAYPGLADPSPSVTSHSYPPPTAGLMDRGFYLSDIPYPGSADPSPSVTSTSHTYPPLPSWAKGAGGYLDLVAVHGASASIASYPLQSGSRIAQPTRDPSQPINTPSNTFSRLKFTTLRI